MFTQTKAAPEKKRPGRPPLKRNDAAAAAAAEDADWNSSSRRKMTEKFASSAANVWCDRERRRSSLRMSSFTTVDSDSEMEILTATVKPTARVMPAVKRKEGGGGSVRVNRDSSCESIRNDGDFNVISDGIKSVGGGGGGGGGVLAKSQESPPKLDVECIAVQDKKKSDTLRKLFSRREEGGGKTGGKGKGGKGKCGVIVMESEAERKLLQRSSAVSPASLTTAAATTTTTTATATDTTTSSSSASNLPKIQDRVPDMTHVAISSPNSQSNDADDRRYSEISRISSAANRGHAASVKNADSNNSGGGGGGVELIPKLTYNEAGRPSLMCKIDLSKIPYILAKKRSEEIRIKCELSDTRQSSTNPMLDGGAVKIVSAAAAAAATSASASSANTVNVPLVEPLSDRRRNNGGNGASMNTMAAMTTTSVGNGGGNANAAADVGVAAAAAAATEHGDLYHDRSKPQPSTPHQRLGPPSASPLSSSSRTRKKHSSKKAKNSKRKHYANEPRAVAVAVSPTPTPPAPESVSVEEDEHASIFAAASTVHTPSVDTADMDSSLSSDSEARKQSAAVVAVAGLAPRSGSKNKKRPTMATATLPPPPNSASLASATASDSVRNNLMTP